MPPGAGGGLLPGPSMPGVVQVRLPGEQVLVAGCRGRPAGEGGCQPAAAGGKVGLQPELPAGGGILLPPGGVAHHGRHGAALHPGEVPLLGQGEAATPNGASVL